MKSLRSFYDQIGLIIDDLEYIAMTLVEKRDAIEEKASSLGRNMTSKQKEKYDYLDNEIYDIEDCIKSLNRAGLCLEGYI